MVDPILLRNSGRLASSFQMLLLLGFAIKQGQPYPIFQDGLELMTIIHLQLLKYWDYDCDTQLDFAWFQLMRNYSQPQAYYEFACIFIYTKNNSRFSSTLPPCWKSQRPTACSALQGIVPTIDNLTFPNPHLRVMACLLDSKHKQRIMNIAKLFQNHSANFQNKGGRKQTNSFRMIHAGCACMKMAW